MLHTLCTHLFKPRYQQYQLLTPLLDVLEESVFLLCNLTVKLRVFALWQTALAPCKRQQGFVRKEKKNKKAMP